MSMRTTVERSSGISGLLVIANDLAVLGHGPVKIAHAVCERVDPVVARPLGVYVLGPERAARGLGQGLDEMRAAVGDIEARAVAGGGVGQKLADEVPLADSVLLDRLVRADAALAEQ